MVTVQRLCVLLLFVIQTSWNYVIGSDPAMSDKRLGYDNTTSTFIILPSAVRSSTRHYNLTSWPGDGSPQSQAHTPSLPINSHLNSYLHTSLKSSTSTFIILPSAVRSSTLHYSFTSWPVDGSPQSQANTPSLAINSHLNSSLHTSLKSSTSTFIILPSAVRSSTLHYNFTSWPVDGSQQSQANTPSLPINSHLNSYLHTSLKSSTSTSIILPSAVRSSTRHYNLTSWPGDGSQQSQANTPSLPINSHLNSYLHTSLKPSLSLFWLTETTPAYRLSEEATTRTTLSQRDRATPSATEMGTFSTNNGSIRKKTTPHASQLNRDTVTATQFSTQSLIDSSAVVELTSQPNQLGDNFSTASLVRQTATTVPNSPTNSATEAKISVIPHSKTDNLLLQSSVNNPGSSEANRYQTSRLNSVISTTQTPRTPQTITTSTADFPASPSSTISGFSTVSTHEANTLGYFHTTLTKSKTSTISSSQIFKTLHQITATAQRGESNIAVKNTSYLSNAAYFSTMFSSNPADSAVVRATPSSSSNTSQNISQTTSRAIKRTTTNVASRTSQMNFGATMSKFMSGSAVGSSVSVTPGRSGSSMSLQWISEKLSGAHYSSEPSADATKLQKTTSHSPSDKYSIDEKPKPHLTLTSIVEVVQQSTSFTKESTIMPLYLLAICLPLAFVLGFTLAYIYFKRTQQDHRTQYSVTVEVTSEKSDYEMKRMYSIIDINAANINKDFWTGLKNDNSSSSIVDLTSTKPTT